MGFRPWYRNSWTMGRRFSMSTLIPSSMFFPWYLFFNGLQTFRLTNRIWQILGIAEGVGYLHEKGIIHSNLNIVSLSCYFWRSIKSYIYPIKHDVLISQHGEPLICSFSVARIISVSQPMHGQSGNIHSTPVTMGGTPRWMSPELLIASENHTSAIHTMASDVWAFGMIAYVSRCFSIMYLVDQDTDIRDKEFFGEKTTVPWNWHGDPSGVSRLPWAAPWEAGDIQQMASSLSGNLELMRSMLAERTENTTQDGPCHREIERDGF